MSIIKILYLNSVYGLLAKKAFVIEQFLSKSMSSKIQNGLIQSESGVQSYDLDGVGSIPAIPQRRLPAFVDHFNKQECFLFLLITIRMHMYQLKI